MVFIMKTQVLWPAYVARGVGRDWIGGFGKGTRADFSSLTHCACDTHIWGSVSWMLCMNV